MQVYAITYNLNNNKVALSCLIEYINTLECDILLLSIQEYFSNLTIKSKFIFIYQKRLYGLHSVILSNRKLETKFYCFCLGRCYIGCKGVILASIDKRFVFVSLHLKDGENNYLVRYDQLKFTVDVLLPYKSLIVMAGDFNFRFKENSDEYKTEKDEFSEIKKKFAFLEPEIKFTFTYKYKNSEICQHRIKSYCDRIIYNNTHLVNPCKYFSLQHFVNSDHKPVLLKFLLSYEKMPAADLKIRVCHMSSTSCFIYDNIIFVSLIACILIYILICIKSNLFY